MLVDTRFIVLIGNITVSRPAASATPTQNLNFLLSLRNGTNIPIGWQDLPVDKVEMHTKQLEQDRENLIELWEKNHKEPI